MIRWMRILSGFTVLIILLSVNTLMAYKCKRDPTSRGRSAFDKRFEKWPGNEFVYKFNKSVRKDFQAAFINAAKEIAKVSCLKFKSYEDAKSPKRYLNIYETPISKEEGRCEHSGGVYMFQDKMELSSSCEGDHSQNKHFIALIVHELFHALGFHHTQKRADRDKYVTFHKERVLNSNDTYQFEKCSKEICDYHNIPYDCKSIMHYQASAFGDPDSSCSLDDQSGCTLTGKTEECKKALHQSHNKMTKNDITHLNLMYPCSAAPKPCNRRCNRNCNRKCKRECKRNRKCNRKCKRKCKRNRKCNRKCKRNRSCNRKCKRKCKRNRKCKRRCKRRCNHS